MLESLCQVCRKRPASSHLIEVSDTGCLELHICIDCIAELGLDLHDHPPPIASILESYEPNTSFVLKSESKKTMAQASANPSCPACGLDWQGFRRYNRFGCPTDYDAFGELLIELMGGLQHGCEHVGRLPASRDAGDARHRQARREDLERRLQAAIGREAFEEAARLRDELRAMSEGS